jgi:hypothetical protein
MRVEPPTSTTSSICDGDKPASFERLQDRAAATLDERRHDLLELGARQRHVEVLRTVADRR